MKTILSIVAVLGVGSIVAALISWRVAISNHRQAWINALRDDVATYFKELEAMYYVIGDLMSHGQQVPTEDFEQKKRDARLALLFTYWRIVLRLNRTESMHIELRNKLDELMTVTERVPNKAKVEEAIDLSRRIFKQEWEVTKYGAVIARLKALKT